jgi:hypothetical protein
LFECLLISIFDWKCGKCFYLNSFDAELKEIISRDSFCNSTICLNSDNCLCKDKSTGKEGCYINKTMRYKFAPVLLKVGWVSFSFALTNLLSAEGELNQGQMQFLCVRDQKTTIVV